MVTHSNVKRHKHSYYIVQRQTKKGNWVPLRGKAWQTMGAPEQFGIMDHGEGLKRLREWVWFQETEYPYQKPSRRLGKLRVVKVTEVKTEQKFYEVTELKARQRRNKEGRWVASK